MQRGGESRHAWLMQGGGGAASPEETVANRGCTSRRANIRRMASATCADERAYHKHQVGMRFVLGRAQIETQFAFH